MTFSEIQAEMKRILKPSRYTHTIGVVYTAAAMAMKYDEDINRVMLAGLLHDASKSEPREVYVERAKEYGIACSDYEIECPELIHGKLSAYMAEHIYGVEDAEILSAILCHTTGKPAMSLFEKIIYIADYIEPSRDKQPNLAEIRKLAFGDIDAALVLILKDTIEHINRSGFTMDPKTVETYNYYKKED